MLELLSVLMCGGGGGPAPAPMPPPAPLKRNMRSPASEVKRRQATNRTGTGGGVSVGSGDTLFSGTQGIGDLSLTTGKTLLGG